MSRVADSEWNLAPSKKADLRASRRKDLLRGGAHVRRCAGAGQRRHVMVSEDGYWVNSDGRYWNIKGLTTAYAVTAIRFALLESGHN